MVFPVTACAVSVAPPFNMYLIDAGLLPFSFELSDHVFVTFTLTLSLGTVNVLVTFKPVICFV